MATMATTIAQRLPQVEDADNQLNDSLRKSIKNILFSTPGKTCVAFLTSIFMILAAGAGNITSMTNRSNSFKYIKQQQRPLLDSTINLRESLANMQNSLNEFVLVTNNTQIPLHKYLVEVSHISSALASASVNDPLHKATDKLIQIGPEFSKLTAIGSLVIQNKKKYLPMATAQLHAFNEYVDNYIKPTAIKLERQQNNYLDTTLTTYSHTSYASFMLALAALLVLICLGVWLRVTTKRTHNGYLLAAGLLLALGISWFSLTNSLSSSKIRTARNHEYVKLIRLFDIGNRVSQLQYNSYKLSVEPSYNSDTVDGINETIAQTRAVLSTVRSDNPNDSGLNPIINQTEELCHSIATTVNSSIKQRDIYAPQNVTSIAHIAEAVHQGISVQSQRYRHTISEAISSAKTYYKWIIPCYYVLILIIIIIMCLALRNRLKEYK